MNLLTKMCVALLPIALSLQAAEPSPEAERAVLTAEAEWKTAVLKADRNALEKLLTADLSYTHSSGKTQTKEQFITDVTSTTTYKSIDFTDTKVRQYGSAAVITHSAVIVTVQTGTAHLYLMEVWSESAGRWQMASRLATKVP